MEEIYVIAAHRYTQHMFDGLYSAATDRGYNLNIKHFFHDIICITLVHTCVFSYGRSIENCNFKKFFTHNYHVQQCNMFYHDARFCILAVTPKSNQNKIYF